MARRPQPPNADLTCWIVSKPTSKPKSKPPTKPAKKTASKAPTAKEVARAERLKKEQRKQLLSSLRRFGIATVVVIAVLGISSLLSRDSGPLGDVYEEVRSFPVACGATAPPPIQTRLTFDGAPDQALGSDPVSASIVTSCGTIEVALDQTIAPAAVNAFVFLARQGYYNGVAVHRLQPDLEVRFGDPTATGEGHPGFRFDTEKPADDYLYKRGVLALAHDKIGRNNGQIFIVLAESYPLAPIFSPIGSVTAGEDTLDRIASVSVQFEAARAIQPVETIYIESVTIHP